MSTTSTPRPRGSTTAGPEGHPDRGGARPIKDFLAVGAAARLRLERRPRYAQELNPDEGVWNHLKPVELRNRCCQELQELRWELSLAIRRLRRKRHVLVACFRQCGYS
jgi:transposase